MRLPKKCLKCGNSLLKSQSPFNKDPLACNSCGIIYWSCLNRNNHNFDLYATDFIVDKYRIINFYDPELSIIDYNARRIQLNNLMPFNLTKKQIELYLKFY